MKLDKIRGGKRLHVRAVSVVGTVLGLLAASSAWAQAEPPPPASPSPTAPLPDPPVPQRIFGVGVSVGGGFSVVDGQDPGLALLLPSLEVQAFLPSGSSIDFTSPIVNNILLSTELETFVFSADAFFNINGGETPRETARLVLGPGLGFAVVDKDTRSLWSLRIPAQIGVEVLSEAHTFGVKLLLRPWAEFVFERNDTTIGGGALAALVFSGYGTVGKGAP